MESADAEIDLYHTTSPESANAILEAGFRNSPASEHGPEGVWFAPKPVRVIVNDVGVRGETIICVRLPQDLARRYAHDRHGYSSEQRALFARMFGEIAVEPAIEFSIPADVVNAYRERFRIHDAS